MTIKLNKLYNWYRKHHRDLPFRRTKDAYAIWVSEVMLQQTRVAAMLPKYTAFMDRFASVYSLATADQTTVLEYWQGLGYYRRARLLHKGARQLVTEHDAVFPRDLKAALGIHGVGAYTAAAVLSIAYDVPVPVLDGNVRRVITRLYNHKVAINETEIKQILSDLMEKRGITSAGLHNQAIMELGATLCTPGLPDCAQCPLNSNCLAFQSGGAEYAATLPAVKKEAKLEIEMDLFFILHRGSYMIVKDKESRFFKSMWFLPYRLRGQGTRTYKDTPGMSALLDLATARHQGRRFRHHITHHNIQVQSYLLEMGKVSRSKIAACIQKAAGKKRLELQFVKDTGLDRLVVSSLMTKARQNLLD